MKAKNQHRFGDIASYGTALVLLVFFLMPLAWLLSLALRDRSEVFLGASRFIPHHPTLQNFAIVLNNGYFPEYLWNGLFLSVSGAVGAILVSAPAAYAFSRINFAAKKIWMLGLLVLQMVSALIIMIPLYRYMGALGLLDTHFAVIVIYIAVSIPMCTWLLKSFTDGIPVALDEAAMIDGCSRFQAFIRVTLPLTAPGLASAFILTVIGGWSQFLIPFILLNSDHLLPIGVGIYNFAGQTTATSVQLLAAACLISVMPAIVTFLLLQRMILSAMTAGAVKG